MNYVSQLASTTELVTAIGGDVLATVGVVVGIVLGVAVFSVGVSFGWRKLKQYALGKKF